MTPNSLLVTGARRSYALSKSTPSADLSQSILAGGTPNQTISSAAAPRKPSTIAGGAPKPRALRLLDNVFGVAPDEQVKGLGGAGPRDLPAWQAAFCPAQT